MRRCGGGLHEPEPLTAALSWSGRGGEESRPEPRVGDVLPEGSEAYWSDAPTVTALQRLLTAGAMYHAIP